MARKGVAVSQIILLVLGILVLAVVAYLLYTNFVTTGGAISTEQCRAAATRACTACSIANAGSIVNCLAKDYLKTNADKQCASQGSISGSSSQPIKDGTGAVTGYTEPAGSISCQQYVGGGGTTAGGGSAQLCPDGSAPASKVGTACPAGYDPTSSGLCCKAP